MNHTIAIANLEDFAELSPEERANCAKLPRLAFRYIETHEPGNRIVGLRRGERGYFKTRLDRVDLTEQQARDTVALYNKRLCVTEEQQAAMLSGSLFGFHTPGANPDIYQGQRPIKSRLAAEQCP